MPAEVEERITQALRREQSARVKELAQDCGLSVETVTELLTKGWSYVTTLDQPPRWDHPIARMEIEKECSNGV